MNELFLLDIAEQLKHPFIIFQIAILLTIIPIAYVIRTYIFDNLFLTSKNVKTQIYDHASATFQKTIFPIIITILLFILKILVEIYFKSPAFILKSAISIFFALIIIRVFVYTLSNILPKLQIIKFEKFLSAIIWLTVILYLTGWTKEIVAYFVSISFEYGTSNINLWDVCKAFFIITLTAIIALWATGLIEKKLIYRSNIDNALKALFSRILRTLCLIIAVLFSMSVLGIDITALSILGGALGVGIGFGLQKIASNYISGFIILLDRSIRPDDYLVINNDIKGWVTKITTRYTVLDNRAGLEYIVPNEMFVSQIVQNRTFSDKNSLMIQSISISYDSDVGMVLQLIEKTIAKCPVVLVEPPPKAYLSAFEDSGLKIEFSYTVGKIEDTFRATRSDINLQVFKALKENNIVIPFPQREIRILDK